MEERKLTARDANKGSSCFQSCLSRFLAHLFVDRGTIGHVDGPILLLVPRLALILTFLKEAKKQKF